MTKIAELSKNTSEDIYGQTFKDSVTHLSYSSLSAFAKSPRHFYRYKTEPREVTEAMTLGTVVHSLLLEGRMPDNVKVFVKPVPESTMRKKENKEAMELLQAEYPEAEIISQQTMELAEQIVETCPRNISDRLDPMGEFEKRYRFDYGGHEFLSYLDYCCDDYILDLKVYSSIDPRRLKNAVLYDGLKIQAALYCMAHFGEIKPFYFAFLSNKGDGDSCLIGLSEATLQEGLDELDQLIVDYDSCTDFSQSYNWKEEFIAV